MLNADRAVLSECLPGFPEAPGRVRTASPGEALDLATDAYWLLVEGEVVVYRAGRPIEVWCAPRPLDLAGTAGHARSARFVAASAARLFGVPRTSVDAAAALAAVAREASGLWQRIEADARRDDDTFTRWADPVPGPWWFRQVRGVLLAVQGDAARLRECLPPGVHLLPGSEGRYLLVIGRFDGAGSEDPRDRRQFSYHEVTPFVPVWSGLGGPALYTPELYPDAWMAMVLGREIHGFPKRIARVGFREDGADLLVERRLALRVRWTSAGPCSLAEAVSGISERMSTTPRLARLARLAGAVVERLDAAGKMGFPVLVRKRIGDPASSGRTREIDALVRLMIRWDPGTSAEALDIVDADIPGGPGILHGAILAGWALNTGFRFGPGAVVRRYRNGR